MRRAPWASFIGTVIEFYDFDIYGVATALVLLHVFFLALGPLAGVVRAGKVRYIGHSTFPAFGDRGPSNGAADSAPPPSSRRIRSWSSRPRSCPPARGTRWA
jgi:hypothetical protein